jgi:G:T-mismatch repair DNA endonuclease (very short patch repair protein)
MEREFAAQLRHAGVRFRKQHPIFGKPDLGVSKWRIAIFCGSHFWHGYQLGQIGMAFSSPHHPAAQRGDD